MDDVHGEGIEGVAKKYRVGVTGEICPVIASVDSCSAGCLTNSGLVCAHEIVKIIKARRANIQTTKIQFYVVLFHRVLSHRP